MKKLKIGVIGAGAVAEISHFPMLVRMPELETVKVADIDEKRLERVKSRFNLQCETTTNYQEILEDKKIQGVLILTPPNLHHKMVIEAAESHKHIFVEKPFALNSSEAKQMISSCKENGVVLNVGFTLRFITQFSKMRDLIFQNYLGKILTANSVHFTDAKKWPSVSKFQLESKRGGGALFEMGAHHIDLMVWFFGTPSRVSASIRYLEKHTPVDDYATVFIQFKEGVVSNVNVGWVDIYSNFLNIGGSSGYATVTAKKNEVIYYRKGHTAQAPIRMRVDPQQPINMELFHFYKCSIGKEKPVVKGSEIINGLRIIEEAYESNKKGSKWIDLTDE